MEFTEHKKEQEKRLLIWKKKKLVEIGMFEPHLSGVTLQQNKVSSKSDRGELFL